MKRYLQVLFSIIFCLLLFVYSNETVKGQDEGGDPGPACLNYVYSDRYTTKCENEFENAIEVSWSLNYAVTSTDNLVRYQRQGASCSIPTSTSCNSADNTQDCGCYRVDGFRKNITNLRPSSISNISRYDITVTTGAIGLAEHACFAPSGASRNQTSGLTCITNRCGDGVKGTNEACDSSDLGGKVCTNFPNYESGSLSCDNTCRDFTRVGGTGTTTPYAGCTACNTFARNDTQTDRNIVSIQNPLNPGTVMASGSTFKCFIQMDHQGPDVACVMIKPDVSTTLRYCQFNKWNNITINSQTKAQAEFDCTVPQVTTNTGYIVYGLYPLNHSSSSPTAVNLTNSCGYPQSSMSAFAGEGNSRGFIAVPADSNPPTVQLFETNTLSGATVDEFRNVKIGLNCTTANSSVGCNNTSFKLKKIITTTPPTSCPTDYSNYDIATIPYPNPDSQKVWYCGAAKDNIGNVGFSTPFEVAPGCRNQCLPQDRACVPGPYFGTNNTSQTFYYSVCVPSNSSCLEWVTESSCTQNPNGGGCSKNYGCINNDPILSQSLAIGSVVDNNGAGIGGVTVRYSITGSTSGQNKSIADGSFAFKREFQTVCKKSQGGQCTEFGQALVNGDASFTVDSPPGYNINKQNSYCRTYDDNGSGECVARNKLNSSGTSCDSIKVPFEGVPVGWTTCPKPEIKFVFDKQDTNAPNVIQLLNSDNPTVGYPVTIKAKVQDSSGIRKVTIYVDGGIAATCINNPSECIATKTFTAPRDIEHPVKFYAVAEDMAGNMTTFPAPPGVKSFTVAELTSASCAGTGTSLRATGLVSTPKFNTNSKFGTSGGCVVDPRAAFVSFKIPTYADLFSLHYTQAKESTSPLISKLEIDGDATQNDLVFNQKQLIHIKGDLNLEGNPPSSANGPGVVFVNKNLTFKKLPAGDNYTYGKTVAPDTNDSSGTVFVVKGNVIIEPTVSEINAVIIAQGIIYTAGNGCAKNSVPLSNQLVINGSLVSLQDPYKDSGNQDRAIHFCRSLTPNNASPSEKINLQPKYLSILRNIFATSLQKWAEIPGFTNIQTGSPAVEKPEIQTFTGDSCFSSNYKANLSWTGKPSPATSSICPEGFNVEISDVIAFPPGNEHVRSRCVDGSPITAPDAFTPGFTFERGKPYFARVSNGRDSITKELSVTNTTCSAHKRVFVTSTIYPNGNLGGLTGAKNKCQASADAVNLGGTWDAWISDDTGSPSTRFTKTNEYRLINNTTIIANNWEDLTDGFLQNPINLTELNETLTSSSNRPFTYTGTKPNGTLINGASFTGHCNRWTDGNGTYGFIGGYVTNADNTWTQWGNPTTSSSCSLTSRLYCFEQ